MSLQCRQLFIEIAGKQVCQQLDLTIMPGQVWGILGRNGIGKTTLLHTLAGLRDAEAGDILLDEQHINLLSRQQVAQKVGVLLQHHEDSFPATVLETVLTGRHPHITNWQWESETDFTIARRALQQVDMHTMENNSVQHLSGGERQRVAIATLLAQDPTYYLLDEPNSHLDLHYQVNILDSLCQLARSNQRALIMTLHDINLASRFCDYVLLLNGDGEVLQGATYELLQPQNLAQTFKHEIIAIRNEHGTYYQPK